MLRFSLNIDCDNAAFDDSGIATELARILRKTATQLEAGDDFESGRKVYDVNGNAVGIAQLKNI